MTRLVTHTTVKGRDDYGPWVMVASEGLDSECPLCHKQVHAMLAYTALHLPSGIQVSKTRIKRTKQPMGVDCGCHAKFHRQIAHIVNGLMSRGVPV